MEQVMGIFAREIPVKGTFQISEGGDVFQRVLAPIQWSANIPIGHIAINNTRTGELADIPEAQTVYPRVCTVVAQSI